MSSFLKGGGPRSGGGFLFAKYLSILCSPFKGSCQRLRGWEVCLAERTYNKWVKIPLGFAVSPFKKGEQKSPVLRTAPFDKGAFNFLHSFLPSLYLFLYLSQGFIWKCIYSHSNSLHDMIEFFHPIFPYERLGIWSNVDEIFC